MVSSTERATALTGMKEICEYMGRSDVTILKLIRDQEFPACKIGGIWEADKDLVDEWRKDRIRNQRRRRD